MFLYRTGLPAMPCACKRLWIISIGNTTVCAAAPAAAPNSMEGSAPRLPPGPTRLRYQLLR